MKVTKEEVLSELAQQPQLSDFDIQVLVGIESDDDMIIAFMPDRWSATIIRPCYEIASKLSKRHNETYEPIVMSKGWFATYRVDSGFSECVEFEPDKSADPVILKCGADEVQLPFNRGQFRALFSEYFEKFWD